MDLSIAQFWQAESSRYYAAASQSAGRVYLVLSFGIAAVATVAGAGLLAQSSILLAFSIPPAAFMLALVFRCTFEAFHWSGFQRYADLQLSKEIERVTGQRLPVWRASGPEPLSLVIFNRIAWSVALATVALYTASAAIAAELLNGFAAWAASRQPDWAIHIAVSFGVLVMLLVMTAGLATFKDASSAAQGPMIEVPDEGGPSSRGKASR